MFNIFRKKKEDLPAPSERRNVPRWPVKIQTSVSWQGQDQVPCVIDGLNLKGFSISLPVMLPQSLVKLQVHLSPDFQLSIDGMTLWYRNAEGSHKYGILITRMRNDDRERLYSYIRQNFPDVVELRIKEDAA